MNITKKENDLNQVTTEEVRDFWQKNPLSAANIPYSLGSREYFEYYNTLREKIETLKYSNKDFLFQIQYIL